MRSAARRPCVYFIVTAALFLSACSADDAPGMPAQSAASPAPGITAVPIDSAPTAPPPPTPPPTPQANSAPSAPSFDPTACPLTGLPAEGIDWSQRRAILVQIGNSPPERPQSELALADVVFEHLTEGGITRFSAVYL
ncbi:MAG: DUF3048 domain-containing protein, partial [Gammaproteobacteria bacterium]